MKMWVIERPSNGIALYLGLHDGHLGWEISPSETGDLWWDTKEKAEKALASVREEFAIDWPVMSVSEHEFP